MKSFVGAGKLLSFFLLLSLSAFSAEIRDATGFVVEAPARVPQRMITLAPSLGELALDLVGSENLGRIVGVSDYTDYPEALRAIPSIGSYAKFSIEKVVALKPDLVLATTDGNSRDQVLHLRELGLRVVVVETLNFEQVEKSMLIVGRALGLEKKGAAMAADLRRGLEEIRARNAVRTGKKKVLLQVGDLPLVVAGGRSFLQDALNTLHLQNIYGDLDQRYPRPAVEDVVSRNPQMIVVLTMTMNDEREFEKMLVAWNRYPQMDAVKNRNVKLLRGDSVVRPTLRLLEGLKALEKVVY